MWQIHKTIDGISYGHRVWTQKLESNYCAIGDTGCKCKHPHGHNASVIIHLTADDLIDGFVTDFKHIGWVKDFLDKWLDHKFILDVNDPIFDTITSAILAPDQKSIIVEHNNTQIDLPFTPVIVPETTIIAGYVIDTEPLIQNNASHDILEFYQGFFLIDFVPTSENLSKWVYDCVSPRMEKLNVNVAKVEWWETAKSCSIYHGD